MAGCLTPSAAPPSASPRALPTRPQASASPVLPSPAVETEPASRAAASASAAAPSAASLTPLSLTLDQKIGLLVLAGINGTEINAETRNLIAAGQVGGIVLRGRNVRDAVQLAQLVASLHAAAAEAGQPLLVAIDQEGGDVSRLQAGATHFPSAMALGAAGDPALAYQVGFATAAELLPLGIRVNLAPVVDVLSDPQNTVIGTRSFGSDPALVAQMGAAFVRGTLDAGGLAVVKHYPGHGSTRIDSHAGLPQVATLDLAPFEAAIAQGVPVVMVGHLWASGVDAERRPASLSPAVIETLRRGFGGVILTDSLNMGAITNEHTIPEAAVAALRAGADWLLVAEPADVPASLAAIRQAVQRGEISPERLDASVQRLLALRDQGAEGGPPTDSAAAAALAEETARRAVALDCAAPGCPGLPVAPEVRRILLIAPNTLPPADPGTGQITYLAQLVAGRGPRVTELLYDPGNPGRPADYAYQAGLYAEANDLVLFGAWDAGVPGGAGRLQIEAYRQVRAAGQPVVVLGLHMPFDPLALGPVDAYLASFGATRAQMLALAGALFGDFVPEGRLPVLEP